MFQRFKTGMFLCLYPYHIGFDLPYVPFPFNSKSSIALAHFTSSASDHAVPMSARPNGIPVEELTLAGSVIIGYPSEWGNVPISFMTAVWPTYSSLWKFHVPAWAAIWYVCATSGGTNNAERCLPLFLSAASMPSSLVDRWQNDKAS